MKQLSILLSIITFLLSGCGNHPRAAQLSREMTSESALIREESGEIMRCLQENDREGFKALFCERSRGGDTDEKVDRIFELIGSDFISCDFEINSTGGSGKTISHGETTDWHMSPGIEYITFSYRDGEKVTKKYFEVRYYWVLACKDHPDEVGIQEMRFIYLNVETISIGDYYS